MSQKSEVPNGKALAHVQRCLQVRRRLLATLEEAGLESRRVALRSTRRYLWDRRVRTAAVAEELKQRRGLSSIDDLTAIEAIKLAESLNMWAATTEFVAYVPKEKADGTLRWHHRLGLLESARQRLLKDVARASFRFHENQFAIRGGAPRFEAWLSKHLPSSTLVITTDIPNCHGSMRRSSVAAGLPLPGRVKEAALSSIKDRATPRVPGPTGKEVPIHKDHPYYQDYIDGLSSPGRGIPTGAALSAFASEVIIANVIEAAHAAAPGVRAAAYSDNLIALLEDASAAASVIKAIASAVATHFGSDVIGELTRRTVTTKPVDWFAFCGTEYRLLGGELTRRISEPCLERFRLKKLLELASASTAADFEKIRSSIKGWALSVPLSHEAIQSLVELSELLGEVSGPSHSSEFVITKAPAEMS